MIESTSTDLWASSASENEQRKKNATLMAHQKHRQESSMAPLANSKKNVIMANHIHTKNKGRHQKQTETKGTAEYNIK